MRAELRSMDTRGVLEAQLTPDDYRASSMTQSLDALAGVIDRVALGAMDAETVCDVGCGYGGLGLGIAAVAGAEEVIGVDINTERLRAAADRGMQVHEVNIETQPLPMADNSVDVILSFGMIEHLRTYDDPLAEMHRVLQPDGWYLLGFPNLGSWLNRINLLRGYQPRDVEVSQEFPVGYAPGYPLKNTLNHVHSATDYCMRALLAAHGLDVAVSEPAFPYQQGVALRIIDAVASLHPPLARRLLYAGTPTDKS